MNKKLLIVGLTGEIAVGKNLVASYFARSKLMIFDADFQTHQLFSNNSEIFEKIRKYFPKAIVNQKINREILGKIVFTNKAKLHLLESIIHPLIDIEKEKFLKQCRRKRQRIAILNIPLLFEKGGYKKCDKIILVKTSQILQKEFFAKRLRKQNPNISLGEISQKISRIKNHQTKSFNKAKLSDFVIINGLNKRFCQKQVTTILNKIKSL